MPQGYDARESGNSKFVNGKRVALPTRSGNETTGRRGGERGPTTSKGTTAPGASSTTGRKGNTSLRDMKGVAFNPDPANYDSRATPISSIANDVRGREINFRDYRQGLISHGLFDGYYKRSVPKYEGTDKPTARPYGKEGSTYHPDKKAAISNRGADEAMRSARAMGKRGSQLGLRKDYVQSFQKPYQRSARELREQASGYEKDYTDKYMSHQTERMRDMMGKRRAEYQTAKEQAAAQTRANSVGNRAKSAVNNAVNKGRSAASAVGGAARTAAKSPVGRFGAGFALGVSAMAVRRNRDVGDAGMRGFEKGKVAGRQTTSSGAKAPLGPPTYKPKGTAPTAPRTETKRSNNGSYVSPMRKKLMGK